MARINILLEKMQERYGEDGFNWISKGALLDKYVANKGIGSANSASTIRAKLNAFAFYLFKKHGTEGSFDKVISSIKEGKYDPYDVLSEYALYLQKSKSHPNEIGSKVRWARKFLRFCRVPIDVEQFRDTVTLPKHRFPEFDGVSKSQIVELLNACKNQRLKTALMLYASTGARAVEGTSVRLQDVDLEKRTITFRAEFTKTKRDRTRPITRELCRQIETWLALKYRPHYYVRTAGGKREHVVPERDPEDLILGFWQLNKFDKDGNRTPKPDGLYQSLSKEFQEVANIVNLKKKNGRKVVTFHRLRAFCKSTVSDLGYADYSEWLIGHSGSTYYRKPWPEILEIFGKLEGYLTFLDVRGLQAKHAEIESDLEAKDKAIQTMQEQLVRMDQQHKEDMARIMSLIQANPTLANIKPEVLAKKEIKAS